MNLDKDQDDVVEAAPDQLTVLKERADLMGIKYHPSISLEKLREKVNGAISGSPEAPEDVKQAEKVAKFTEMLVEETAGQKRSRLKKEANELIRIRITCLNPAKKEWDGEIFTCGNSLVGTVSKYVPFNADNGWHVPRIIYNMIRDRQCQIFVNKKSHKNVTVREGKLIKEFGIEILDPLTEEEIKDLAQRQAMAKSID